MNKLKFILFGLGKISLICLVCFMLSPSLKAQAKFNDTANINMGIKLELGTVSLASENIEDPDIVNPVKFTEGNSVLIASSNLINDGSLSGKLAYKIDITKENGEALIPAELKETFIIINFKNSAKEIPADATALNTNSFTFVKDANNKDVIIDPDKTAEVPVSINYKSKAPINDEKLTVKVTFRLIQSNAKDANAKLFSDEEIIENTVNLVPKVVEPESDWPEENTFIQQNGFSYSMKNMKMLFSETSETFNTNKRQIKNLNKAVLYIQLPKDVPLTKTVTKDDGTTEIKDTFIISKLLTKLSTENGHNTGNQALVEESRVLDKEHRGIIITFRLQDEYSYNSSNPSDSLKYANNDRYSLTIAIEIQKYSMYNQGVYGYYTSFSDYIQFFATRLLLSSDAEVPTSGAYYAQLPIKLTTDMKHLSFKEFNTSITKDPNYVEPIDFTDIKLNKEKVRLEVAKENSGQIVEQVFYSPFLNNEFSLWLKSNNTFNGAILNVRITGDAGNTLIISRQLIASTKYRLTENKSRSAPIENQESEQQVDVEISKEPTQSIDGTLPDEQIPEDPVEEVAEEEAIEESVINPPIQEVVEPDDTVTEPIEGTNQIIPEEKISDQQINE